MSIIASLAKLGITSKIAAALSRIDVLEAASAASGIRSSNVRQYLDAIAVQRESLLVLRKVNATRFEVFTPGYQRGMWYRWRFDSDSTQFTDANPSDVGLGLVRPFLQTTVQESYLETTSEILAAAATAVSAAPVTSGNYQYLNAIGDYFEFTVTDASRIRITYQAAVNAGTFTVTIDGSAGLVNLVPKDAGGNATIDAYASGTSSVSLMIADNLPAGAHTVRVTVAGKNAASSDNRCYLSNVPAYGALRTYLPWSGSGAFTESGGSTLKIGGSAVDYAIAFAPLASASTSGSFYGSVHGYEGRQSLLITYDAGTFDLAHAADGSVVTAQGAISIEQNTSVYHPEDPSVLYATTSSNWTAGRRGFASSYVWTWARDVKIFNGYQEMWSVYGANSGGAGGALLGWADRVRFGDKGDYPVINGDMSMIGHVLTNEVVFWGTPYDPATGAGRNKNAGDTVCVVSLPEPTISFNAFACAQARADAIWVQDRPTFRKMYLQSLRGIGPMPAGASLRGKKAVAFFTQASLHRKL